MGLSPRAKGVAAAVVTILLWTSFIVVTRGSADPARAPELGPYDLAFTRILGAALLMLPLGWWMVRRDRAGGAAAGASSFGGLSPLPMALTWKVGVPGGLVFALCAYLGFMFAPASHAAVLMPGSLPLWTTLLAVVVLGIPVTPARALGLALIVAGALVVGGRSLLQAFDGGSVWIGDLLFMTGAVGWAFYGVLARRHALEPVRATVAVTVLAFCTYVPVYLALIALGVVPPRLLHAPWGVVVFQMIFQGVGSVVVSGIAFVRMVQYFGPVRSTMLTSVVPALAALGGVVFLGEPLGVGLVMGLALVTAGIVVGVRAPPSATSAVSPAATATSIAAVPPRHGG